MLVSMWCYWEKSKHNIPCADLAEGKIYSSDSPYLVKLRSHLLATQVLEGSEDARTKLNGTNADDTMEDERWKLEDGGQRMKRTDHGGKEDGGWMTNDLRKRLKVEEQILHRVQQTLRFERRQGRIQKHSSEEKTEKKGIKGRKETRRKWMRRKSETGRKKRGN